jgi:hypothetical protein
MNCARIQTGQKEPLVALIVDANGDELTGKSDIKVKIRRLSDGYYFDWSDNTFKSGATVTQLLQALLEVNTTYSPGEYYLNTVDHSGGFDTSKIVNANDDDVYFVTAIQDGGTDAANVPLIGEIKVGSYVDDIVEDRYPVVW